MKGEAFWHGVRKRVSYNRHGGQCSTERKRESGNLYSSLTGGSYEQINLQLKKAEMQNGSRKREQE